MVSREKVLFVVSMFILVASVISWFLGLNLYTLYAGIGLVTLGIHLKQFGPKTRLNIFMTIMSFILGVVSLALYVFM